MIPYTKKYQPSICKEVIGQEEGLKELNKFVTDFKKQKKKAVLIYGSPGVGKTCCVYSLANELGLEVVEINASDVRTKEQIEEKVGAASQQLSLFSKGKLILVDEVDGLAGREDRGGIQAITKLVEKTSFPMILTAINPWGNKLNSLRRKCNMVEFEPLEYQAIFRILSDVCKKEKIKYEDDVLKGLARRAGGDVRAAITDLQTLSFESKELTKKSLEELSERNKEDTIINGLIKIFKTTDAKIAATAFDNVREDFNERFLWLDENLPKEYEKPEDLARAYDKLSKADVFNKRIKRWQHWRFLVYINLLTTAGIAVSKDEKYKKMVSYTPTGRILKLWWAKQKSMKKKAIAEKIAEKTHSSVKCVLRDFMPYMPLLFRDKAMKSELIHDLDLSKEEVEWLNKLPKVI